MPKLKPSTEKKQNTRLTNLYIKNGMNQAEVARKEGVSRVAINQRINRPPVQKALQDQINATAKKVGISLTWLLKKYKLGVEESDKIIGYLHQFKKDENGKVGKAKPDEAVSNEFIKTEDWATRRLYMRDIAEIMKWIRNHNVNIDQSDRRNIKFTWKVYDGNGRTRDYHSRLQQASKPE